jgi:hypothetical protein
MSDIYDELEEIKKRHEIEKHDESKEEYQVDIGKFFWEQICADFQKLYLRRSYTLAQNIRGKIQ